MANYIAATVADLQVAMVDRTRSTFRGLIGHLPNVPYHRYDEDRDRASCISQIPLDTRCCYAVVEVFKRKGLFVRHTGIHVVFCHDEDGNDKDVWCLDWGVDDDNVKTLSVYRLEGEERTRRFSDNTYLTDIRISLSTSRLARFKLGQLLEDILEYPKDHDYCVTRSDPDEREQNCRGFCLWVMQQMKQADFGDNINAKIKKAVENIKTQVILVDRVYFAVAAPFLRGSKLSSSSSHSSQSPSSRS